MKITGVETFVVDAGWRPWQFVAVRTDAGPHRLRRVLRRPQPLRRRRARSATSSRVLVGQDPRPVERIYWDLYRMARQSPGGIAAKAIAGIELALWDVKAKALGVPGLRALRRARSGDRQRVYWSHCGTSRAMNAALDRRAAAPHAWTTSAGWARRSSAAATARSRPTSSIRAIPRASTSPASAAGRGPPTRRHLRDAPPHRDAPRHLPAGRRPGRRHRPRPELQLQARGGEPDLPGPRSRST